MKIKYTVILLLLLLIHGRVYSLDFNFVKTSLNNYNGIMTDSENNLSYYFTADLINLNIINNDTDIGLFVSPLQYSFISYTQTQLLSFVNLKIYYNLFHYDYDDADNDYYGGVPKNIFGAFFSINWMNLKNFNEFDFNNVVYSAGLLISYRDFAMGSGYDIKKIYRPPNTWNHFTLELGYKNIDGKGNFYIGVQISDPFTVFFGILYVAGLLLM
jgi:hypothetical protein